MRIGRRFLALTVVGTLVPAAAGAMSAAPARASGPDVRAVVRLQSGAESQAEAAIHAAGGTIVQRIGIVNADVVMLPAAAFSAVAQSPGVLEVTPDASVHLLSTSYDPITDPGSMLNANQLIGAPSAWTSGATGQGVDVALIDSGVAPVTGVTNGKVINGPDLSFESQAPNLASNDTFGHGTHMAGIIAGNDAFTGSDGQGDNQGDNQGQATGLGFQGVAIGSRIVSLKVADAHGNTDISQMLAAIDWVVQNKDTHGLHVRVLNLSFGTDSSQPYVVDPLAFAVEQAWKHGIVVVAAAGNGGAGAALTDPAYDPFVIAVGATTSDGTRVADFSSTGEPGGRTPDLVAPGSHIVSLRSPGSFVDQMYATTGEVGTRFFRGSGTSQATAVVSGAAAVVLSRYPDLAPDQVKALLTSTATPLASSTGAGAGLLNVGAAVRAHRPEGDGSHQLAVPSTGLGTLDGSRGDSVLVMDGVALTGNVDIFGNVLDPASLAKLERNASAWKNGSEFNGLAWTGTGFTTDAFQRSSWSRSTWSRSSWSRSSWSRSSWSGVTWTADGWTRSTWSSGSWDGDSWSRSTWSGDAWSRSTWSRSTWSGDDWTRSAWSRSAWSRSSWSDSGWAGASWS